MSQVVLQLLFGSKVFFQITKDILSYAKKHPNVVYIYKVVGGWDVEIEVEVENYEKLKSIINEIRNKFSESIRYYETFLFYEEHKIIYMPMTI